MDGTMALVIVMIFDVVMIILGIYMVIAALKMKRTNKLGTVVLTEEEVAKCKDKAGFVAYIYWRETVMGVTLMICGVIRFLDKMILKIGGVLDVASVIILLLVFLWFYKGLQSARTQFL